MNIQQLEYIIAVDKYKHFVTAAEKCYITQATLSTMIKKLEQELNVIIFDRTKHPVITTPIGKRIIEQAHIILKECSRMREITSDETQPIQGVLKIGIIPTLAPYLLPLFLRNFTQKYRDIKLRISELITGVIVEKIKSNELDIGIVALPIDEQDIVQTPLFIEDFVIYSPKYRFSKKHLRISDLDINKLCLMEEGHCMRNQILKLCKLKSKKRKIQNFDLAASSIDTLIRVVEINGGLTILPYLSVSQIPQSNKQYLYYFSTPIPARKIGIISFRYFTKEKLLVALKEEIVKSLPNRFDLSKHRKIIK